MNETELYKLWTKISTKMNFGTFDSFKSKMNTVEKRKRFYEKYYTTFKNDGIYLGAYDKFESRLGTVTSTETISTTTPVSEQWSTFPCVVNQQKSLKLNDDDSYSFKSTDPDYGYVTIYSNGTFSSTGSKVSSGRWSCTKSGKIYIKSDRFYVQTDTPVDLSKISPTFSCIVNNERWGKLIKVVKDNYIVAVVEGTNVQFIFYSDNKFTHKGVPPYGLTTNGTWECKGENQFICKTEDDAKYDSETNNWEYHVGDEPISSLDDTQPQEPTGTTKYLKLGDKGELVGKLQDLLKAKGFTNISKTGETDKIFGNRTKNSVIDFQSKNGLRADGVVGPNTWEKLTGSRVINESEHIKKIVYKNLSSFLK